MVDAARIGQTEKGPIMDSHDDEPTEILRAIWQQLVTVDKNLNAKIDQTNAALTQTNAALSDTNATLRAFMQQTHENFGRVHRNFDKVNTRLEHLELGTTRADDLDARLTRVETHVGLRED